MKLNIMAILIGIVLTAVLAIFGFYVGLIAVVAPIIAGLIVGYTYTDNAGDGALNAGIGAGIGGMIYSILAFYAALSFVTALTYFTASTYVPTGANLAVTAIGALVIDFILGAIGGYIGVSCKRRTSYKNNRITYNYNYKNNYYIDKTKKISFFTFFRLIFFFLYVKRASSISYNSILFHS